MEIVRILFTNQFSLSDDEAIKYEFSKNKLKVTYKGSSESLDFEGLPDGKLKIYDEEKNKRLIKHNIGLDYLLSAEKKEGTLYLNLLNHIPENANWEEKFNSEIDYREYTPTLFGEERMRMVEKEQEKQGSISQKEADFLLKNKKRVNKTQ